MLVLEYLAVACLMSVWQMVHSCYLVYGCLLAVSTQELLPTNVVYVNTVKHLSIIPVCIVSYKWSGGTASLILDFSMGWRWVTGFITGPQVKAPCTHLYRRVGGPQRWSGHFGEDGNLLPLLGTKLWFVGHQTCNIFSTLTLLFWCLWYNELNSNTFKV